MFEFTTFSISSFDGETNIVAIFHDRESVLTELNTLREESPGFDWLPNELDMKTDLNWDFEDNSLLGMVWKDENRFVNITVHNFEISAKIEISNQL